MRRFLTGAMIFGLALYGAYIGIVALQHYFALSGLVEQVVEREMPKVSGWGWGPIERGKRIRDAIMYTAEETGIVLEAEHVAVTEQGGVLAVRATYRYPVVTYRGTQAVVLPISTAQTFAVPGGAR